MYSQLRCMMETGGMSTMRVNMYSTSRTDMGQPNCLVEVDLVSDIPQQQSISMLVKCIIDRFKPEFITNLWIICICRYTVCSEMWCIYSSMIPSPGICWFHLLPKWNQTTGYFIDFFILYIEIHYNHPSKTARIRAALYSFLLAKRWVLGAQPGFRGPWNHGLEAADIMHSNHQDPKGTGHFPSRDFVCQLFEMVGGGFRYWIIWIKWLRCSFSH